MDEKIFVVVVDSDVMARNVIGRMLKKNFPKVEVRYAVDPAEAGELVRTLRHQGRVVLVTDAEIPWSMAGFTLVDQLLGAGEIVPSRVLIVSSEIGRKGDDHRREAGKRRVAFLEKMFDQIQLVRAFRPILEAATR